jgi:glycosyltransferase involved in cell wall biosynthesis
MTPEVSVLIPVFNSEKYLSACLDSVFKQDSNFEIILVDNGSTDKSLEIATRFADNDERLKIFHCPQKGVANALNMGLDFCTAHYVARLDSDDLMLPGRLKAQAGVFLSEPNTVLASSQIQYIDSNGIVTGVSSYPVGFLNRSYLFGLMNPIAHPAVMFKLSKVRELGGYDPKFEGAEDLDLWIRLASSGNVISQGEILTQYRIHDNQVSNRNDLYKRELHYRVRNIRKILLLRPNAFMLFLILGHIFSLITLRSNLLRKFRRFVKKVFYER